MCLNINVECKTDWRDSHLFSFEFSKPNLYLVHYARIAVGTHARTIIPISFIFIYVNSRAYLMSVRCLSWLRSDEGKITFGEEVYFHFVDRVPSLVNHIAITISALLCVCDSTYEFCVFIHARSPATPSRSPARSSFLSERNYFDYVITVTISAATLSSSYFVRFTLERCILSAASVSVSIVSIVYFLSEWLCESLLLRFSLPKSPLPTN